MQDDAVLTLEGATATYATFGVKFVGHKNINRYQLWVQLDAFDANGVDLGRSEAGISAWNGDTAMVTLSKSTPPTLDHYAAHVWLFPDNTTPVSNTVTFP